MNSYLHDFSAKLYEQARAEQPGDAAPGAGTPEGGPAESGDENVVDADFDIKDDDDGEK